MKVEVTVVNKGGVRQCDPSYLKIFRRVVYLLARLLRESRKCGRALVCHFLQLRIFYSYVVGLGHVGRGWAPCKSRFMTNTWEAEGGFAISNTPKANKFTSK